MTAPRRALLFGPLICMMACSHLDSGRAKSSDEALPVLRVGTSGDYAPFSRSGTGFDVEVAERMALDLGYRIRWVRFTWPTLRAAVLREDFDIAMSGITWQPERAVLGAMSRAVALGGVCLLRRRSSSPDVRRLAVNHGGFLERWTRAHYPDTAIVTVDDNLSLPRLLAQGDVDAIVTDSFEVAHFSRPAFAAQCEPGRERKVYWVVPSRARDLAPRIDGWLARHEPELHRLRRAWFGQVFTWTATDHLVDLLDRRLRLMPAVSAYKRRHGLPIEDTKREARVIEEALAAAARAGLEAKSVRALFVTQIELAKAIQARRESAEALDLHSALRPTLSRLGERIITAVVASAEDLPTLQLSQLDLLKPILEPGEIERLLRALRQVHRAPRGPAGGVFRPIIRPRARDRGGEGTSYSGDGGASG